ncbi:protein YIPF6 homolog [Cyclospora cayetanensis]|uniref:Protein YIPF n=2 Tax=Cyclospora cayetanensis TaxID=88456 RepID=A0A1D3D3J5_9EIME|nr:protein YIPF6 homolog [Cyclospora cayetanensis]OEH78012.1 YIP1 domain-containing protein [Cyclospora cayetanensis]
MMGEMQPTHSLDHRGETYVPASDSSISLDEPVIQTIMRDLRSVWEKMLYVLKPKSIHDAGAGLRDWELWGPLVLCVALSLLLYFSTNGGIGGSSIEIQKQRRFAFALVYMFVIAGSSIVTLNAQLLGSRLSFFQSVCVLGYCLFPLTVAAAINLSFLHAPRGYRLVTVIPALAWATRVASAFMRTLIDEKKKLLVIYPVALFYVSISAIICAV